MSDDRSIRAALVRAEELLLAERYQEQQAKILTVAKLLFEQDGPHDPMDGGPPYEWDDLVAQSARERYMARAIEIVEALS